MLSNVRVVLVRPHYAGNIGAVARLLMNFGLSELVLVDPVALPTDPEAIRLSMHAEAILHAAKIVPSFSEAIHDCQLVYATSAITEGLMRERYCGTPDELFPGLVEMLPVSKVALVFGPEPTGLTRAELTRCHHLLHIPTALEYSALNLSHAVGICLYALFRCYQEVYPTLQTLPEAMPDMETQERMLAHLQSGLEKIHFVYGPKGEALMHAVRQMIHRARPREKEVRVLFGLAKQLHWIANQAAVEKGAIQEVSETDLSEEVGEFGPFTPP